MVHLCNDSDLKLVSTRVKAIFESRCAEMTVSVSVSYSFNRLTGANWPRVSTGLASGSCNRMALHDNRR